MSRVLIVGAIIAAAALLSGSALMLVAPVAATLTPPGTAFSGNVFDNGHIEIQIGFPYSTIYSGDGDTLLAGRMYWMVEQQGLNQWLPLAWDGVPQVSNQDTATQHIVVYSGVMGRGQLEVSIRYEAAFHDQAFVGFRQPIQIKALAGTASYRVVLHVDDIRATSFEFDQRQGTKSSKVLGPIQAGTSLEHGPSGENSLLALGMHGWDVRFGLNWVQDPYSYVGTTLSGTQTSSTVQVAFGTTTLSKGQQVITNGPIPDGGGGGGGGSTPTNILGYVYLAQEPSGNTLSGIYGAQVTATSPTYGTFAAETGTTGGYLFTLPAGDTYTVTAWAYGYCGNAPASPSGCARNSAPISVPVATGGTGTANPMLHLHYTLDNEASTEWFDLNNYYSQLNTGSLSKVVGYTGTNNFVIEEGCYNYCLGPNIPAPPSGASNIVEMIGNDISASSTGYGYVYFNLLSVHIPLSAPMVLAFNVYDYHTPSTYAGAPTSNEVSCTSRTSLSYYAPNGMISVDLHFTDGTVLRDVQDATGSYILDATKQRIHPGCDQYRYAGSWYRVAADLSELRYKTVDAIMVAYDNQATGGSVVSSSDSNFQVFFDDIRLEMGTYPWSMVNSGFEDPALNGWGIGGNLLPRIETNQHWAGRQSVLIGRDPSLLGQTTVAEDSHIGQGLRIPNPPNMQDPILGFDAVLGTQETSGCTNDWVRVTIKDRTTLHDTALFSQCSNAQYWQTFTYDLSSMRGHIIYVDFWVHQDSNGRATWAYVDEARIYPKGVSVSEAGFQGLGTVDPCVCASFALDNSIYEAAGANFDIPLALEWAWSDSTTGSGMSGDLDFLSYVHANPGTGYDELTYLPHVHAWAGPGYYIHDVSITITVYVESNSPSPLSPNPLHLQDANSWGLQPQSGTPQHLDPIELTLTAADGVVDTFDVLEYLELISLAAPGAIVAASVAIFVLELAYLVWKSLQSPSTANPDQMPLSWSTSAGNGVPSGQLAGGEAMINNYFGPGTAGSYEIEIATSANVYHTVCTGGRLPVCTPTLASTMTPPPLMMLVWT